MNVFFLKNHFLLLLTSTHSQCGNQAIHVHQPLRTVNLSQHHFPPCTPSHPASASQRRTRVTFLFCHILFSFQTSLLKLKLSLFTGIVMFYSSFSWYKLQITKLFFFSKRGNNFESRYTLYLMSFFK